MKLPYSIWLAFLLTLACKNGGNTIETQKQKPNILLINVDDLGWKDISLNGNGFYETPNIDALAKMGMVFTNGYASASNCAPSRANLMSGLWSSRHGILTVGSSERGQSMDRKLIPIKNTTTITDNFLLLPQVLQQHGYTTCHSGKWHISNNPLQNGFDINIGGSHAGHPTNYYPPYKNIELEAPEGKRLTDLVMDKTLKFIQTTDKPFFINYAPYAVHTPIQPVPGLLEKYKGKTGSKGASNIDYATMIQNLDENIGRLMTTLKETGKLDNTFIVFTSDNGGLYAVSHQHPLRAGKGSYYEGGIRVPFFFVWANQITEGQTAHTPISNLDLYPTILAVAGVSKPQNLELDGIDLKPLLTGREGLGARPLFWHFPIYLQAVQERNENRDPKFRTRPGSVVRLGKWKLHHYFEDDAVELYNLEDDLGEQLDLSKKEPEKIRELLQTLHNWRTKIAAQIPQTENPEYKKP